MNAGITLKGIVRGRTIELDHEPGLPDGQQVAVTLRTNPSGDAEALRRAFGGWADDQEGLDEFLAEMRASRKIPRRGEPS